MCVYVCVCMEMKLLLQVNIANSVCCKHWKALKVFNLSSLLSLCLVTKSAITQATATNQRTDTRTHTQRFNGSLSMDCNFKDHLIKFNIKIVVLHARFFFFLSFSSCMLVLCCAMLLLFCGKQEL